MLVTCKCRTGSETTVLFEAIEAESSGKVVGNGKGESSCCLLLSCCNSCNSKINSIFTEANPPPLDPCNEQ